MINGACVDSKYLPSPAPRTFVEPCALGSNGACFIGAIAVMSHSVWALVRYPSEARGLKRARLTHILSCSHGCARHAAAVAWRNGGMFASR
jgi:hypothetical protein